MDNIFFDLNKLKSVGKNVIIGKTVRIRYPELVEIGDNVIIDDFSYISTQLKIGSYVHIAPGCKLIGGRDSYIELNDFVTLAPNTVLAAGSDDYISGLTHPMIPLQFRGAIKIGKIIIKKYVIIGANSAVLPDIVFNEGAVTGALTFVKHNCKEWTVYAGIPAKEIKKRNKKEILELERNFSRFLKSDNS